MPKLKTNRGAKKRFRVTGSGKIKSGRSNRRHLLECKSKKAKRQSRAGAYVADADLKNVRTMLRVHS